MKNFLKLALPVTVAVLAYACGGNNSDNAGMDNHEAHDTIVTQQNINGTVPSASVKLKDDELNAVYQHYVHLTTALTNEDQAEAKIAANAIEAGAKELKGGNNIATNAAKITTASDIEEQRTIYSSLSNDMIGLVKQSGMSSGEVYVDYCPMAMNDKGAYWLSSKKEIRNPYFGDKMMTCGEVKETIR